MLPKAGERGKPEGEGGRATKTKGRFHREAGLKRQCASERKGKQGEKKKVATDVGQRKGKANALPRELVEGERSQTRGKKVKTPQKTASSSYESPGKKNTRKKKGKGR